MTRPAGWLGYWFAPIGAVLYLASALRPVDRPAVDLPILMVLFWAFAAYFVFAFIDNGFVRGTDGPNRYGPDPLARSVQPA